MNKTSMTKLDILKFITQSTLILKNNMMFKIELFQQFPKKCRAKQSFIILSCKT